MKRLVVLLALVGCAEDPIGPGWPTEPDPVVTEVPAPAVADSLWAALADCALRPPIVHLAQIRWHRVEADNFRCGPYLTRAVGCWSWPDYVYLARWVYDEPWWHTARHELLHAWLGWGHEGHADPSFAACAETVPPR